MSKMAEGYFYSKQAALDLLCHIRSINIIPKESSYEDKDFCYVSVDGRKVYDDTCRYFEDRFEVVFILINGLQFSLEVLRSVDETGFHRDITVKSTQEKLPMQIGFLSILEIVMHDDQARTLLLADILALINTTLNEADGWFCLSLSNEVVWAEVGNAKASEGVV
jgi:hypothetical protein